MRAPRPSVARPLALAAGTLLSLALLEGGLWIAHVVLDPGRRDEHLSSAGHTRTILCIGDSNTYGIHLPVHHSYPGRLQSLLDRAPESSWRVVNLGYPGQNSAQVRARLAENLRHYRPEVVICWIGVNNTWSPAMRHLWDWPDSEPEPGLLARLLQGSRALGALRMGWNRLVPPGQGETRPPPPGVAEAFAGTRPAAGAEERGAGLGTVEEVRPDEVAGSAVPDLERSLRVDLRRIRAISEEHGARLLLIDYPLPGRSRQAAVNPVVRAFARENGVALVGVAKRLLALGNRYGWEQVLFADHHATAAGNYVVANLVLRELLESGPLEARPEWLAVPPFEVWIETSEFRVEEHFSARLAGQEGRRVVLELEGPPGWTWWIDVDALIERDGYVEPKSVPIAKEERLPVVERRAYFGRLDAGGHSRTDLLLPPWPENPEGPVQGQRWRITANGNPPEEFGADPTKPDGFWSVVEVALPPRD